MQLTIGNRLGEGGFGDVYEAVDDLGRRLAVKIVRPSAAGISTALDHARALARTRHANVVSIYSLEKIADPVTGAVVDAVVMELVEGETLSERLNGNRFSLEEVRRLALGLIDGLEHIHSQGLAHGDLHSDNIVIAVDATPKIIDILYRDSLALLSTASKETRLRKDVLALRLLLYDSLLNSALDPAEATEFNTILGSDVTLAEVRAALYSVLDPSRREDIALRVDQAYQRVVDDGFIEGDHYAKALAEDTPREITGPLLMHLIEEKGASSKHKPYLRLLWDRLSDQEKREVATALSLSLGQETPKGRWGSPINLLAAFGREGWKKLSAVSQLRLEGVIANDILAGHHDIYGANVGTPGALGTYSNTFWAYFRDRDRLIDNICAKLSTSWYGQNYVGKYLLSLLPLIADNPGRRARLLAALQTALSNDAKLVVRGITTLPPDWQAELKLPDE